jgi:hypothetical protein
MNAVLVLKLALVPMLILGVTLAGRRWGPSVAGWLSAFPSERRTTGKSVRALLKSMTVPQHCSNPFNP